MASTYSPDLRLELMATGDQSGTWGNTTNTNLGTLLEQAICGYLSVAEGDATLTLTANNGASDQSRNMVVNLTGAMTAQRSVVVPTSAKLYLFVNSTTGGFAALVKTTAGTGVLIPPGQSRWVYCDAVNVVAGLLGYRTESFTTTATAAGTTTLDVTSFSIQEFTGTTLQTVVLPVTSTLYTGKTYLLVNQSTGALTVNSSGANLVATVPAKSSVEIVCSLITGTTAASWDVNGRSSTGSSGVLPIALGGTGASTGAYTVVRTQVFVASGTYTPNANMLYCTIECLGGGGGGGGVAGSAVGAAAGAGGGAGGYSRLTATAATIGASKVVTIGTVGTGGTAGNNAGIAGGDTSVGTICIGKGGSGGGGANATGGVAGVGALGGVAGTGDVTATGGNGWAGFSIGANPGSVFYGRGGDSLPFGSGGIESTTTGVNGYGYGSGGGGAAKYLVAANAAGGNGAAGLVIVTEFCSA